MKHFKPKTERRIGEQECDHYADQTDHTLILLETSMKPYCCSKTNCVCFLQLFSNVDHHRNTFSLNEKKINASGFRAIPLIRLKMYFDFVSIEYCIRNGALLLFIGSHVHIVQLLFFD